MREEIKALASELIGSVKAHVASALSPLIDRIAALELRLIALSKPEKGDKGDAGKDGRDGVDGKDGAAGLDGKGGANGKDGAPGLNGKDGVPGRDGNDGSPGKDGRDGADADMLKVEQWIVAAVRQMPPPKNGERGEQGHKGSDGRDGRDGKDGRDGEDGDPGKDAVAVVPQVGINPERSYPRGTWAADRGGLFCSVRVTDPIVDLSLKDHALEKAGWVCVFDGIYDEIEEHLEDGRRIEKTVVWASGKTKKTTRIGRSVIYRGIYKPDVDYHRGDQVTWGGSQWHCSTDVTRERPGGGSPDWVLAVKHGEPGKSARVESGDRPASVVKLK